MELSYDATLKALMAALDAKDEVTEGHCERVAKLTIQLARHMGVPEEQLVDIERGALLHDVGKIGVPDAVLKKPTALNDLEWEAMRKHPLLAGLMVSKIGFLEARCRSCSTTTSASTAAATRSACRRTRSRSRRASSRSSTRTTR